MLVQRILLLGVGLWGGVCAAQENETVRTVKIGSRLVPLPLKATFIYDFTNPRGSASPLQYALAVFPMIVEDINANPELEYFHNLSYVVQKTSNQLITRARGRLAYTTQVANDPDQLGIFGFDYLCTVPASIAAASGKFIMSHNGIQVTSEHAIVHQSYYSWQTSQTADTIRNTYLNTRIYLFLTHVDDLAYIVAMMGNMGLLQTGQYFLVAHFDHVFLAEISYLRKGFMEFFTDFEVSGRFIYPTNIDGVHLYPSMGAQMESYRNVLATSVGIPSEHNTFRERFKKKAAEIQNAIKSKKYVPLCPPFCTNTDQDSVKLYTSRLQRGLLFDRSFVDFYPILIALYDSVMLYAKTAMAMIKNGDDIFNGRLMAENMINTEYTSVDGSKKLIDVEGRGAPTGWLIYSRVFNNNPWPVPNRIGTFTYSLHTKLPTLSYEADFEGIKYIGGKKPTDTPRCGFDGERCVYPTDTAAIIVGAIMAVVVGLLLLAGIFLYRKWRYEKNLMGNLWKIDRTELILKRARELGSGSIKSMRSSMASMRQSSGDMRKSHFSLRDWEAAMAREAQKEEAKKVWAKKKAKKGKRAFNDPEEEKWLDLPDYSMAMHKGQLVGLKNIYKTSVNLTREVRKELLAMLEISHDNLLPFVGAVHEPPHVFLVNEICLRGSLADILENDEIKLDNLFVASIVFDVIKGLEYLHKSGLRAHGRLKSTNCLVDARWVVRLSSFGLHEFREGEDTTPEEGIQEGKELLWTAPEILKLPMGPPSLYMLQKADIYAFGIIMHEIFVRQGPFGDELLEPQEIVDMVKFNKGDKPMRPDMGPMKDALPCVRQVIERCWEEDSGRRPPIDHVRKELKPLQKGLKSNIMDNMMQLMEKYTNNLEEVVTERTSQLDEERKKSERLLLMMLPRTVAETLKRGQMVDAEFFEHVSIYFSDIVGFTSMSSASSPLQVVTFLNDLYTAFDTVIYSYDVYKVETIGDAYMVVSGLPDRNGLNHAGEIASMSLNLLQVITTFKIRHRPEDKLQLRIGIHSGSCVAGVVGLRMPRYCLFGDTVNTASRMESNGEAQKIHCSGECKNILDELGGYETEERGLIAMKGKGEQLTYWVVSEDQAKRNERLAIEAEKYPSLDKKRMLLL